MWRSIFLVKTAQKNKLQSLYHTFTGPLKGELCVLGPSLCICVEWEVSGGSGLAVVVSYGVVYSRLRGSRDLSLLDRGEQCRSMTPANLGQGYWDSGGIHHCSSLKTQTRGKATEVAGGGKKASKILMHSAERSCHTWLWKIIPDACSAKMEL